MWEIVKKITVKSIAQDLQGHERYNATGLGDSNGGMLLVNSSLAACAHLHTAAFAHECEHLLSRHDTSMRSRTASSYRRQPDLLLVNVTSCFATEATLRLETDLQHAGPLIMPIPYQYGCAYSFSNGKCISFCLKKRS